MRHSALDVVRRRQAALAHTVVFDEEPSAPPDPEDSLSAVADMLSVLSDEDRLIVTLRLYENLSYGEIARVMNVSAVAVQKRYRRALTKLRKDITGRGVR